MKNKSKASIIKNCIIFVLAICVIVVGFLSEKIFGENSIITKSLGKIFNGHQLVENIPLFIITIIYIGFVYVIQKAIRIILQFLLNKTNKGKTFQTLLDSVIKYLAVIILIFLVLSSWGVDTATLVASIGILGLVVGLAAQPVLGDIIAGLFILFEGTFKVGDIVVIDGFRGTVQSIGIRNCKIIDAGGDIKIVSNSSIANIINQTKDLSIAICDVGFDYRESVERVESVLKDNFTKIKENVPGIAEGPFYKGVAQLGDSSIVIRIVARCKEEDKYQVIRDINREILIIFNKNNINIPFPQVVINYPNEKSEEISNYEKKQVKKFIEEQKELSKNMEEQEK